MLAGIDVNFDLSKSFRLQKSRVTISPPWHSRVETRRKLHHGASLCCT